MRKFWVFILVSALLVSAGYVGYEKSPAIKKIIDQTKKPLRAIGKELKKLLNNTSCWICHKTSGDKAPKKAAPAKPVKHIEKPKADLHKDLDAHKPVLDHKDLAHKDAKHLDLDHKAIPAGHPKIEVTNKGLATPPPGTHIEEPKHAAPVPTPSSHPTTLDIGGKKNLTHP